MSADADDALIDEQIEFYRTDAAAFDDWLGTLLDPHNHEPTARSYRAGRRGLLQLFAQRAPLGDVLEIAAGTGRLADLYLPHAGTALLLDASPESLAIAARWLDADPWITFAGADIFDWRPGGTFDTIVFSCWLHHVPHARFAAFWATVEALLARGGRVIFDFPDADASPRGVSEIPAAPTGQYRFYVPRDGVSVRDLGGRRWRVVHNLWHRDELCSRLAELGWSTELVGPGLFDNVIWAEATRRSESLTASGLCETDGRGAACEQAGIRHDGRDTRDQRPRDAPPLPAPIDHHCSAPSTAGGSTRARRATNLPPGQLRQAVPRRRSCPPPDRRPAP